MDHRRYRRHSTNRKAPNLVPWCPNQPTEILYAYPCLSRTQICTRMLEPSISNIECDSRIQLNDATEHCIKESLNNRTRHKDSQHR